MLLNYNNKSLNINLKLNCSRYLNGICVSFECILYNAHCKKILLTTYTDEVNNKNLSNGQKKTSMCINYCFMFYDRLPFPPSKYYV